MRQKIAFIRTESWPHANVKMAQVLQDEFSDCDVMTIDVYDRLKSQPLIVSHNILEVIKTYGREILTHKKRLKRCFWRTPYIFHQIKKLVQETLRNEPVLFSFQTQSIFDGSVEGIPHFVYTDHTHLANLSYPTFKRSDLYNRDWIELEKTIYANASLVFVRSSNIIDSLVHEYQCPQSKIICAYAGSNAIEWEIQSDPAKYHKKRILFVGIDWERKGGNDLIKAFELTRQVYPDATLTVVGCSPEIHSPNCRVMGRVPVDKVSQYFDEASIFCLPTRLEPFGIVFAEAMASRLPIVATNVGAIPDFVRNGVTGFLIQSGDVKGIADALIALLSDPQKSREFGEKGYELARNRYTWKAVGRLMKEHILNTMGALPLPSNKNLTPAQESWHLPTQDSSLPSR